MKGFYLFAVVFSVCYLFLAYLCANNIVLNQNIDLHYPYYIYPILSTSIRY